MHDEIILRKLIPNEFNLIIFSVTIITKMFTAQQEVNSFIDIVIEMV